MPAFHFEGSSDSGFQVSGILEADDESLARRKAQRFCGTSELVVLEIDAAWQGHLSRADAPDGCPAPGGTGRKRGLFAALFGRRASR